MRPRLSIPLRQPTRRPNSDPVRACRPGRLRKPAVLSKNKITLVRSTINPLERHKRTVKALGLKRLRHSVVQEATPQIRGMVKSIEFMLEVEELAE